MVPPNVAGGGEPYVGAGTGPKVGDGPGMVAPADGAALTSNGMVPGGVTTCARRCGDRAGGGEVGDGWAGAG